jgi:hypothetical protein
LAGASAGIIAAQAHYPVRLLRHYADRLQKQAKQASAGTTGRSAVAWTLLTESSPLPEGPDPGSGENDFRLEEFERLLAEAGAAERANVPNAALQRLVTQAREEDAGLRSIPPGKGRQDVLALLAANFFRYQLARNRELAAWWQAIEPAPATDVDPVATWFRSSGVQRIERLVELRSLDPVAVADTEAAS